MKVNGQITLLSVSVGLAALLWQATALSAAPPQDGHSGRITSVQLNKATFNPGDLATIEIEVENDGVIEGEFLLEVTVTGPSGRKEWEESKELEIPPESALMRKFFWDIPVTEERAIYALRVRIIDANDDDVIFDESETTFEALLPAGLWVSRDTLSISGYRPGETKRATIAVRNTGEAPLEWEVTKWPDDWLDLIGPTTATTDDGFITVAMKPTATLAVSTGEIVIVSNAGEKIIQVVAETNKLGSGVLDRLELNQKEYRRGDDIVVDIVVENNIGYDLEYVLTVEFRKSDGSRVLMKDDIFLNLSANAVETVTFIWTAPPRANIDDYLIVAKLYYRYGRVGESRGLLYSQNFVDFSLLEGPNLAVSLDFWKFGNIIQGETPGATIEIRNESGTGTLTWQASSYPDWIEVTSEESTELGSGQLHLNVSGSASEGDHSGVVEISSNGGKETISVSVSILPSATATPIPIPTLTASPTPLPVTVSPTPGATLSPESTATPEEPTTVPTPTVTASATITPVPRSPTLVPSPAALADSPTPTPSPPSRLSTATPSPVPSTPATPQPVAKVASPGPSRSLPALDDDTLDFGPQSSAGSCGRPVGHVSITSGLSDMMMLIIPWSMLPIYGGWKRRSVAKKLQRKG